MMEIKIDFTKSAQENAAEYYAEAKRLEAKRRGAEKAVRDLSDALARRLAEAEAQRPKRRIVISRQKAWYEKFHWFTSSDGFLSIGGRDAKQNELINSKHFDDNDLFFHANVFGASVVILKNGVSAGADAKLEAAQFAACYSSAWESMQRSVDVYAMRRDQVSKSTSKGSLGVGSFLLKGEREWFKDVQPSLVIAVKDGVPIAMPRHAFDKLSAGVGDGMAHVFVEQGRSKKSDAAKEIASRLGIEDIDSIMLLLPSGSFRISTRNTDALQRKN